MTELMLTKISFSVVVRGRVSFFRFLEGDFETYISQMRLPYVWGGEPELLMCSHVLELVLISFSSLTCVKNHAFILLISVAFMCYFIAWPFVAFAGCQSLFTCVIRILIASKS